MGTSNSTRTQKGKHIMLGNEAIAWGTIAAGVDVAAGYPGTPSSEVLQTLINLATEYGHYVEWSANEKVAVECAAAAAWSGLRSIAVMKHLGLNVAADALTTLAYTGVRGGMVVFSSGDAQCHTSSNEQDARVFARFAKIPVLDPADPEEGFHYAKMAFEISEALELPIILNSTPRLSHTSHAIDLGIIEKVPHRKADFMDDKARWICVAASALERHRWLNTRLAEALDRLSAFPLIRQLYDGKRLGIVTNGVAYNYAVEAVEALGIQNDVSLLKLGMSYPFPTDVVTSFASEVDEILVIEELEPFVEDQTRVALQKAGLSTRVRGKNERLVPIEGELNPSIVSAALIEVLGIERKGVAPPPFQLPRRPPIFCPGCPHRSTYYGLRNAMKQVSPRPLIVGDIGCYTLVSTYPFELLDTLLCMGAGAGMAHGFFKAGLDRPIVAIMGDSTLFHSGLPPLVNIAYNNSNITVLVLDNRYTAMTGFQPNPGTGIRATGEPTPRLSIKEVVRSLGFSHVNVVPAHDSKAVSEALVSAITFQGPSIVISEGPCALQEQRLAAKRGEESRAPFLVESEVCIGCRACLTTFGCSAIQWDIEANKATIDPRRCIGCGDCVVVCQVGAIKGESDA